MVLRLLQTAQTPPVLSTTAPVRALDDLTITPRVPAWSRLFGILGCWWKGVSAANGWAEKVKRTHKSAEAMIDFAKEDFISSGLLFEVFVLASASREFPSSYDSTPGSKE